MLLLDLLKTLTSFCYITFPGKSLLKQWLPAIRECSSCCLTVPRWSLRPSQNSNAHVSQYHTLNFVILVSGIHHSSPEGRFIREQLAGKWNAKNVKKQKQTKKYIYQQDKCEPSLCVLQVIRRYSDFDALNSSLMVSVSTDTDSVSGSVKKKASPLPAKLRLSQSPSCWESSVEVHLVKLKVVFVCVTDFPEALAVAGAAGRVWFDCFFLCSQCDSHWYVPTTD